MSQERLVCPWEAQCVPGNVSVSQLKPLPCQRLWMGVAPRDHALAGLELQQGWDFRGVS